MQKLASIETLHSVRPHPNADKLDLAKVLGFQVVIKKGDFKEGEPVVFIWPDTLVKRAPWNEFLAKDISDKPIKVKSIKLRGEFSTGLVMPMSIIPKGEVFPSMDDVSPVIGVTKYIKDEGCGPAGNPAGSFPSHLISKTDEDNAHSTRTEKEFRGLECYLTLKIDGQSLTAIHNAGEVIVCSRNLKLKEGSGFWDIARKYDIPNKLKESGRNLAIQGERFGVGIQSNPLQIEGQELAVFNVKDLDNGKYLGLNELQTFCDGWGLPMVPVIQKFTFDDSYSFDKLQEMADALTYPNGKPAEGMVLRPVNPVWSDSLGKPLSVKFINRNYKD